MESVSHYSCCNAELHFNRTCEVTFSANGTVQITLQQAHDAKRDPLLVPDVSVHVRLHARGRGEEKSHSSRLADVHKVISRLLQNFAFFKGDTRSCTYPCRKLQDGVMRLEECAPVVGVLVCTDEMNVVEEGIQYQSQPCPMSQAPGHQGG
ncbi:hypothetical protein GBF38_000620 [Nibea albiflora]|nr:hypothetical protein GBF38_000620 [Nibea albiflora]